MTQTFRCSARIQMTKKGDFPGGPVTEIQCSQCKQSGFDPCSGNEIPRAAAKHSHVTVQDSCMLQRRSMITHAVAKTRCNQTDKINIFLKNDHESTGNTDAG